MKPSFLRLCSAFLLLGIGLTVCVGVIAGAVNRRETAHEGTDYVWIRLPLEAEALAEICLYSDDGLVADRLNADEEGHCITRLLPAGNYYAVTQEHCTAFSLSEQAEVMLSGGCGWFDGQTLHLSVEKVGSLTVTCQSAAGQWTQYTLENGDYRLSRTLRGEAGTPVSCHFSSVPYGQYRLEENGVFRCYVTLSAETPRVNLSLP